MSFAAYSFDVLQDGRDLRGKTAFESCVTVDNSFYLGTSDGQIFFYGIERVTTNGRNHFETKLVKKVQLSAKKPVTWLGVVNTSTRKLLALCDGSLHFLHPASLAPMPNLKPLSNVSCVCFNERDKQFGQVVIARKKTIQVCEVAERLNVEHEVNIARAPIAICAYGDTVIYSDGVNYYSVDLDSSEETEIAPFSSFVDPAATAAGSAQTPQHRPQLKIILGAEALVASVSNEVGLGIFVSFDGNPTRSTLTWEDYPRAVGMRFPYVLGVLPNCVQVHSLVFRGENKVQQTIPLPTDSEGVSLTEYKGRVLVVSTKAIFMLTPVPFDTQIDTLLRVKQLDDALSLAEKVPRAEDAGDNGERRRQRIRLVCQKAGFIAFGDAQFADALKYFSAGGVDVRNLLCLFPRVYPVQEDETRVRFRETYAYDDVNDVVARAAQHTDDTEGVLERAYSTLEKYLLSLRGTEQGASLAETIDTSIAKVYAEVQSPSLYTFLEQPAALSLADLEPYFSARGLHYALSLLYRRFSQAERALDIWTRLASGEIRDAAFPGVGVIVAYLQTLRQRDIVFKYAKWLLASSNPATALLGADVFIGENAALFNPLEIHELIRAYGVGPEKRYLSYQINELSSMEETFHTRYATILVNALRVDATGADEPRDFNIKAFKEMDNAFAVRGDATQSFEGMLEERRDAFSRARLELIGFLRSSHRYRAATLWELIADVEEMRLEQALLHSRMNQHEKALDLLVLKLHDHTGALRYCHGDGDNYLDPAARRAYRRQVYLALLKVYLSSPKSSEDYTEHVMRLLDEHLTELDPAKVLELLPDSWHLQALRTFLLRSVHRSHHELRDAQILRGVERSLNIQTRTELAELQRTSFVVTELTGCGVCHQSLAGVVMVRYPNGLLAHMHCARDKSVCPATGVDFKKRPWRAPHEQQ